MRRGLTTYTTLRAALTACVLCVLLMLFCLTGGLPAVSIAGFTLMLMPVFLMITGLVAGFIPLAVCTAVLLASMLYSGGAVFTFYGALYILPMLGIYAYGVYKKQDFRRVLLSVIGALFVSQLLIFALLQRAAGGQLYEAAGQAAASYIETFPGRDYMLYLFCSMGLLGVPSSMKDTALIAVESGFVFSPEAVAELINQVRSFVSGQLQAIMPALLVSGSVLSGVMGLGFGIYFGQRSMHRRAVRLNEPEQDIPSLDMPELRYWHIPRGWGIRIGFLGIGYLIIMFATHQTVLLVGALMWQVFSVCYALQGLASIHHSQRQKGTGKFWRIALIVAAMTVSFMQTVLIIFGVADQITDPRGLRPPLAPHTDREE